MYFGFIPGVSTKTGQYREKACGLFDSVQVLNYESPSLVLLERQRYPKATDVIVRHNSITVVSVIPGQYG